MNSPDKDVAEPYPEQTGEPAPAYCQCGTDDRGGACNRCEVVSEEDLFPRRDVIHPVIETLGWGLIVIRGFYDIPFQLLAVGEIQN